MKNPLYVFYKIFRHTKFYTPSQSQISKQTNDKRVLTLTLRSFDVDAAIDVTQRNILLKALPCFYDSVALETKHSCWIHVTSHVKQHMDLVNRVFIFLLTDFTRQIRIVKLKVII